MRVSSSRRGDGGVDDAAGHVLAALRAVLDAAVHALVVGDLDAAAGVVAHRHPAPAAPADGQALQQRGALAGGAGGAVVAVRGGVAQQQLLVGLVLVPADVAGVGVGDQRDPLLAGQGVEGLLAVGGEAFAAAAVGERAGVAGVVQGAQHPPVLQRHPGQLALAGAGAHPHREQQPVGVELLHGRARRAGAGEQGEHVPDGLLHTGIRVEHDLAGRVVDQPDRQAHLQFAAAGLGPLPADQAGPDEVQFGLAHGALQAEQQPVVEVGRVIQPVLVADQRGRHGADLQQPVPVGVVAGQPGDLQAQHDPGAAHADLGDQPLEAFPVGGAWRRTGPGRCRW